MSEGPDCSPVGALQLGQTVTGALAADDCLFDFGGNMDNWSLSLTSTQRLRIDLKSSDFDEIVLVRDQQGNIIIGAVWGGPTDHARLETELSAGEWIISVTSPFETARGTYNLTVDVAPPCTPGTDFVLGETVTEISPSDCLFDGYAPADSFGINITEETAISIHLKSADFDPFVILRDENGMDIEVGFDEQLDGNAWIRESLSPGSGSGIVRDNGSPKAVAALREVYSMLLPVRILLLRIPGRSQHSRQPAGDANSDSTFKAVARSGKDLSTLSNGSAILLIL